MEEKKDTAKSKIVPKSARSGSGEHSKSVIAEREEEILKFWREKKIFKKTLEKPSPKGDFVFYDGPPFATGLPHFGHILGSTIKDAVPRYQTMRGFHVERVWGWDCHGLPIENIVEKQLKISGKKQIEEYGVAKFNEYARTTVLTYVGEWRDTVERIGRWVDFDGSYKTMDTTYIESVWWALKELSKKNLVYEGTRVLPYCPRCETPIANSEIAMDNSFKDITDISVYVKFELVDDPGTYFVAWTTTPWTLPGNTALAVNPEAIYVKAKAREKGGTEGLYIIAKERVEKLASAFASFEIESEMQGRDLIGGTYKPPFDYYLDAKFPNREHAWKVHSAPFVTLTDGTGIVHIAPGYGEEDMALAKKNNIPVIIHVTSEGRFKPEIADFAGLPVKPKSLPGIGDGVPKDAHQITDIEIIKHLAHAGLLLQKEKIVHSYPHCYRCETPLYYTALPAWFINIQEVKPELLKLNEDISWIPEHLKEGRFRKSMEGAPDWNISRNRFWASPLPVWKCDSCGKAEFIGSLGDLAERVPAKNSYMVMRHGESENVIKKTTNADNSVPARLTTKGREEVKKAAEKLKGEKIDLIFASPLIRTVETAEIVAETLGMPAAGIIYDERLKEINSGVLNNHSLSEYRDFFATAEEKFVKAPEGGETLQEVKNRTGEFMYGLESKYAGKKILIVSHGDPIWMMHAVAEGTDVGKTLELKKKDDFLDTAEISALGFVPLPHNGRFELDLHRPYIDEFAWPCSCGGVLKRIPEVIDCWFESGSMPFAQFHAPIENQERFEKNFPARFVSEYVAQTRTWFYYMHAVSAMLFGQAPFEHVVTTGNVLAEDGQKMSKSKNNFPDPWKTFDAYGVDALRFYLLSSPLMRSEDLNFSEKGVDEAYKKIILRLSNVLSFYELYREEGAEASNGSTHVLDRWILARLNQLVAEVTLGMESFEIDRALKPVDLFIEDLSTWYLRRSRERLKEAGKEKTQALQTLRFVLREVSKILAPFLPFISEHIYSAVADGGIESVHLESWPEPGQADEDILAAMKTVRETVSMGLEARAKAGIKVRQPLAAITLKRSELETQDALLELIRDELNVKRVEFNADLSEEVELDSAITPELRAEGEVREIVRSIQDLRKKAGLNPSDKIILHLSTDSRGEEFVNSHAEMIRKAVSAEKIHFGPAENGEEIGLDGLVFKVRFEK